MTREWTMTVAPCEQHELRIADNRFYDKPDERGWYDTHVVGRSAPKYCTAPPKTGVQGMVWGTSPLSPWDYEKSFVSDSCGLFARVKRF